MMHNKLAVLILVSITFLSACKKDSQTEKSFTLEMKINGVQWTATKNIAGLYDTQKKSIQITGGTVADAFNLAKDTSVTGLGTFYLPSGSMSLFVGTGSSQKQYMISTFRPQSRGTVTLLSTSPNNTGLASLANTTYPEANFSAVLYETLGTDSIIISEGKLRYQ